MTIKPSTPFSSGTEYECFLYYFCQRCSKGKFRGDGFPEFPENDGCPILDAMEYARFGEPFPSEKIVRLVDENGKIKVWNCWVMISSSKTRQNGKAQPKITRVRKAVLLHDD